MLFGCSFINVLLELGAGHPAGQTSIRYLDNIRTMLRERTEAAGLVDVDDFARSSRRRLKRASGASARIHLQHMRVLHHPARAPTGRPKQRSPACCTNWCWRHKVSRKPRD